MCRQSIQAFQECTSLTEVKFPYVQTIEKDAFGSCYSLTEVNFPNVQTIEEYAFGFCKSLTEVNFPDVKTPEYTRFNIASHYVEYTLRFYRKSDITRSVSITVVINNDSPAKNKLLEEGINVVSDVDVESDLVSDVVSKVKIRL